MSLIFLTIIINSANAENDTGDTVKFSIKSKFLTYDRDWNKEIIRVNITVDRLGKLSYVENYYLEGSKSLKFHSSSTYFDELLTNKSIYFNISRQRPGKINDRRYNFIESVIIFDKKIIFNRTVNITNRYRLDYSNIPTVNKSVETDENKNKTKVNSSTFNNPTGNINYTKMTYEEKGTETNGTKLPAKIDRIDIIIIILTIYIVYFKFKR